MNDHSIEVLEFSRIRAHITELCIGPYGLRSLETAQMCTDRSALTERRNLAHDWVWIFENEIHHAELELPDIDTSLATLRKEGAVLEGGELRDIGLISGSLWKFSRSLRSHVEDIPALARVLQRVPDLSRLSETILRVIDRDGSVREDKVPELRTLRSIINGLQQKVRQRAAAYMKDSSNEGLFTSDLASERNGRTVLPLDSGSRGRMPGIVHDVSATGKTVFVEPSDIVELNNDIVDAENRYRAEVFRIMKDLSSQARSHLSAVSVLPSCAEAVDESRARALYGYQNGYAFTGMARQVRLIDARHPFLGAEAVPIQITFDEDERMLIITGPNTGGKTVAIKTLGLLVLMNQFGVAIPVESGSELPLFEEVFVDIGDEQSIQRSLSTFSAHISNLSWILAHCDDNSLVLIDELSSGTDPEEGSYLAESILDELRAKGARCLVTTHLSPLKSYALKHRDTSNASVDFDLETLSPLYTITKGVPGASHAIDIAERNGLPVNIVTRARALRGEDESDVSRMLREINALQKEVSDQRAELQSRAYALSRTEQDMKLLKQRLNEREAELRERELAEESRYVKELRSRVEGVIKELRTSQADAETVKDAKRFTEEIGAELESARQDLEALRKEGDDVSAYGGVIGDHSDPRATAGESAGADVGPIAEGSEVRHRQTGKRGTVERKSKNGWLVRFGSVRMTLKANDILPVQSAARSPGRSTPHGSAIARGTGSDVDAGYNEVLTPLQLDIRGLRAQEAEDAVERQLDRALVNGSSRLEIIHGTGGGVLQKMVRDYLSKREEVQSASFARPEEGGFGKTIVELK